LTLAAPAISIIIPVLNETESINGTIALLRGSDSGAESEIVVVDGDATGSTLAAVSDGSVRGIISARGRAVQMNRGAEAASGDVLLFLHADTLLPPDALSLIRRVMTDGRSVAGAFDLGFDTKRTIFRVTEKYVFLRTRLTKIPFGDQAIFIRRDYFRKLGGYREIPIMEDVDLMKRIRKKGGRIRIIPVKVSTSPRRYEREGILSCTFRNWALQALFAVGVSPERLSKRYRSL
jgi:rSAM/selenodomain-associated transferase 2